MKVQKMSLTNSLNYAKSFTLSNYAYLTILVAFILTVIYFSSAYAMTKVSSEAPHLENLYIESSGTNHVYGFKLCAGDEILHSAKILISSDYEIVTLNVDKAISKGDCKKFGVQIIANDASSIQAKLIEPNRA